MDLTYAGSYGRLKAIRDRFLQRDFIERLSQASSDEFMKSLSGTSYRKEIDELSGLYKMPDLVEVVINAHMARMVRTTTMGLPPLSMEFVAAYLSKWDIENIKTILSSKALNYSVESTDVFLVVQRGMPVGIFSGMMDKDDFRKLIEEKDVESIAKALLRYGYGATILKHIDEAKKGDITNIISALDVFYFSRLQRSYKAYNSSRSTIAKFIMELIDTKNIITVLKARDYEQKSIKEFIIAGGTLQDAALEKIFAARPEEISGLMQYEIGAAVEIYIKTGNISHVETALKRELYKKYLKQFESTPISLEFILSFIIRSEVERDELRSIWFTKYFGIGKEAAESIQVLKYL